MSVGNKPLTTSVFLILLSLADRDRHGLGIADEVETKTNGAVTLGPGTLYNAIRKMRRDGLITESTDRPDPEDDDPRRRYYHITPRGRVLVQREAERLAMIVDVARDKSLIRPTR